MQNKYEKTEQKPETKILEEEVTFDQNLAKILLVGLATTILFFLRNT